MVIEDQFPSYLEWFPVAALYWLKVVGFVLLAGLIGGFLFAAVRVGPRAALPRLGGIVRDALVDLFNTSPRRVFALARLAMQEAIRRRAVVVFVVFVAMLLVAAWFLDPGNPEPARLYLSVVLSWTVLLVLPLALFLSAFSLPADISNKTIFTVVTKPVRASEIVLGRIIGFSAVGTLLLALTGLLSYCFVVRALSHTHRLDDADLVLAAGGGDTGLREGKTSKALNHQHDVTINPNTPVEVGYLGEEVSSAQVESVLVKAGDDIRAGQAVAELKAGDTTMSIPAPFAGRVTKVAVKPGESVPVGGILLTLERGETNRTNGHWHEVVPRTRRGRKEWSISGPRDMFLARVAHHGKLSFKDPDGKDTPKGINVGNEWTYHTYIEGGSLAAAIWRFDHVTPERYPQGLPLHMQLSVFRTYKGEIKKGISGSIWLRNPKTKKEYEAAIFTAQEFAIQRELIRRDLPDPFSEGSTVDLFEEFVSDEQLEVEVRCLEAGQYFGMAQPDLFLLTNQASFEKNLFKGYVSIWLQMVLITASGVMFSTFLNGAVAMMATAYALFQGMFNEYLRNLISGELIGGGPIEAFIRLVTHKNLQSDLDMGSMTPVVENLDNVFREFLNVPVSIFPDLGKLADVDWVARGFDIPLNDLLIQATISAGFLLPMFLAGYVFLKVREVAK